MSVIIQYECNNPKCDFEVRLAKNTPVWSKDTPQELQRVPVMSHNKPYVIELVSDKLCTKCSNVVKVEDATYVCPSCADAHSFLNVCDECPLCYMGVVEENEDMRVWF